MRLPQFSTYPSKKTAAISTFAGLNQNLIVQDNEWADMHNISDRFYPAIASRPKRGALSDAAYSNPKCLMYKNGLFVIDGTKAYYKGVEKFTVTDADKQIVGMGAYICVFPDGIMYNTFKDTTEYMAAVYTQSGTITFAPLSKDSVFTKITASGIGSKFSKGDNVTITGCTNSAYNATKIISEAGTDYIIVTGSLSAQFTQSSGLKFERKIPSLDFVTEKDNRIWGCSSENHEIYCCKLGDPKNWYNYETEADNAWASTVGSDGSFTACTKYSNTVLFFKENSMHILRGDKPSNFSLSEKELPGVRSGCDRSLQTIDDVLYYVSRDGVYRYDGAVPQKISDNILQDISDAVSSKYESKLYISCKLGGSQKIIVYDPVYRIWDVENEEQFKYAAYSDGELHFIDKNNYLTEIAGSRDETIEWYLESGDKQESLDQKHISKLKLNIWLALKSELTVLIKFDDEPMWHKKGYIRSTHNKTYTIPIVPKRCSKYRIRLEGSGEMKLLGLSRDIEAGSEINGSLQFQYRR